LAVVGVVAGQVDHKLVLEVVVAVGVEEARVDHKLVLEMEVAAMTLVVVVVAAAEEGARTGTQELLQAMLACGLLQPGPAKCLVHPTQVATARQTLAL
jgi:hypothetical protein